MERSGHAGSDHRYRFQNSGDWKLMQGQAWLTNTSPQKNRQLEAGEDGETRETRETAEKRMMLESRFQTSRHTK